MELIAQWHHRAHRLAPAAKLHPLAASPASQATTSAPTPASLADLPLLIASPAPIPRIVRSVPAEAVEPAALAAVPHSI